MATGYGPRSSRELCTCAAQCLGFQFAPMAARCRSCSSKDIAHVRGVWLVGDWKRLAYFAVRGRAGQVASMAAGLWPALIKRIAHVRGLVPGFSIRGAWPHGTSRAHGGGLMARAHQEGCARSRGVAGRGLEKPGILRGAWPHGTSRARGGGLWPALIKRVAHVRGPVPGFSIRGAWPHGTSRARGGGLWPALIKRVAHVRVVWLVGDWKGLAMGGVWPGAVHLGWSKSPRWMGARRCAGVSFPGSAERKQF